MTKCKLCNGMIDTGNAGICPRCNGTGVEYEFIPSHARESDPETSHEAANAVNNEGIGEGIDKKILAALHDAADGLTASEISHKTGIARDSVTPRLPQLAKTGVVAVMLDFQGKTLKRKWKNRNQQLWMMITHHPPKFDAPTQEAV